MNIDAKAREVAQKLDDDAVSGHVEEGYDFLVTLAEPIIAAALLSVRNEALEEAAEACSDPKLKNGLFGSQDFMFGWDGAAHNIAIAIRALKEGT